MQKQTESKKSDNGDKSKVVLDHTSELSPEDSGESVLSESEAQQKVKALKDAYTVEDCKNAAQSYRRGNLRAFLKSL
jgi:hypothetical protein